MKPDRPYDVALLAGLNLKPGEGGRLRIEIPETVNIAADTVGRHAGGPAADRPALVYEDENGVITRLSYGELDAAARRLAAGLAGLGIGKRDRVAVHLGQRAEAAIAHLAVYYLGAIVVTVSQLYGPNTIRHILEDSGTSVILTDEASWRTMRGLVPDLPRLRHVAVVGSPEGAEIAFADLMSAAGPAFRPVATRAEDGLPQAWAFALP